MPRAIALLVMLLAVGTSVGIAAPSAADAAAQPCWKRVLDDWSKDERIDGNYSSRCLEEALRRVPEDIRAYSNFEEQVRLARQDGGGRFLQSSGGAGGAGDDGGTAGSRGSGVQEVEPNVDRRADGPIASVLRSGGPNDADSIPLPLLILAALALLLAASRSPSPAGDVALERAH